MRINSITGSTPSFGQLRLLDQKVSILIAKEFRDNDWKVFRQIISEQKDNTSNIYLYTNGNQLNAKIDCPYSVKNFKEYKQQLPLFETKIGFIKRIAEEVNKYRK